jgi:hypothetical protein
MYHSVDFPPKTSWAAGTSQLHIGQTPIVLRRSAPAQLAIEC